MQLGQALHALGQVGYRMQLRVAPAETGLRRAIITHPDKHARVYFGETFAEVVGRAVNDHKAIIEGVLTHSAEAIH